ncbi:hypothetical protein J4457_05995 [Candidatus Woesearchaeota archaeon]|nr:hypothetical protein [Candidatus Woesearchaeota archaeon]
MKLQFDPLAHKSSYQFFTNTKIKKDFMGEAPAPFIGRYGYPNVNVGILAPCEIYPNTWEYDAPRHWAAQNFDIPQIVNFRSSLINSQFKAHIRHDQNKWLSLVQEVGMASKPVEMEINLKDTPRLRLFSDNYAAPTGPLGNLVNAKITQNPNISSKVDAIVSDTDLNAAPGLITLFEKGFDENFLSKLLSVGSLGLEKNRKLVPTRWSITATDSTLGGHLVKQIKDFQEMDNFQIYFDGYLGNYFLFLVFPDAWQYELFETYVPKNPTLELKYTTDYEPFQGRKIYAEQTAGGFYACRLAVLELLAKIKRQASVLVLRFITDEYTAPLGVWVVREASRRAAQSKPLSFASKELLLDYVCKFVHNKFGWLPNPLLQNSLLLKNFGKQTKLSNFFS